jgi:Protein of unknown function (DUF1749)
MTRLLGELVTFRSTRGLALDGILYSEPRNSTTIVHVHGSYGNFYQNDFLRVMIRAYVEAGFNVLSFNTGSHDGLAEGYRNGNEFAYVGGAVAEFNECLFEIEGAVAFVQSFSQRVVLHGHSLGCDRILHFLTHNRANHDFVLLAPCDSYELQANWIAPESVEDQIKRLIAQNPSDSDFDWLPSREYGVRQGGDWTYPIPITRKAFLSISQGPPFQLMKIQDPATFKLGQKALIYIGGKDTLQVWPHETMFKYLQERIENVTPVYVSHGDHMLDACDATVAARIVNWLRT